MRIVTRATVYALLCAVTLCVQKAAAAEDKPVTQPVRLPGKARLHLYLLMGQSNMAGRGVIGPEDKTPHPRVLVFTKEGEWEPAVEPVTHDKPGMLGVGPGLAFGKVMAEADTNAVIGLVPCALGGTPLKRWQRGGDLYLKAVVRAKLAMKDGTLSGVLWHQGESDSGSSTNANSYGDRLAKMIRALRTDLGAPSLPFIVAQLGQYLYDRDPNRSPYARVVNQALEDLPRNVPGTACVSSKGLVHKGDQLHFDAASQRELGRRYAEAMSQLLKAP